MNTWNGRNFNGGTNLMITDPGIKACTWLREICSCPCVTVLPGPAWLLLYLYSGPCTFSLNMKDVSICQRLHLDCARGRRCFSLLVPISTGASIALATFHAEKVRSQLWRGKHLGCWKNKVVNAWNEHDKNPFIIFQSCIIGIEWLDHRLTNTKNKAFQQPGDEMSHGGDCIPPSPPGGCIWGHQVTYPILMLQQFKNYY